MSSPIDVAAGALLRGRQVLLQQRAIDAHQGGLWEFPGGKLEAEESPAQALCRELKEELCIHVSEEALEHMLDIEHDYGDRVVRLHVYRIEQWTGKARSSAELPLAWVSVDDLPAQAVPAANRPIIDALSRLV